MSKPKPAAHSQSDFRGEPFLLSPFLQIAILLMWPWPASRSCSQQLLMLVHTHRYTIFTFTRLLPWLSHASTPTHYLQVAARPPPSTACLSPQACIPLPEVIV